MIVRVLPNQLKANWNIINEAIDATYSNLDQFKLPLLRDLMLEDAIAWFYIEGDKIKAVFITKITEDYAIGMRTLTLLVAYGIEKLTTEIFAESFKVASKAFVVPSPKGIPSLGSIL